MLHKTSLMMIIFLCFSGIVAASAQDGLVVSTPHGSVVYAALTTLETFDHINAWESYVPHEGVELGVEQGMYRAYSEAEGFVWGLNTQLHSDVVLEVEAVPLNIFTENAFGVMCRADTQNTGNGYYFMVNSNGYYSIYLGSEDGLTPLIDWQFSEAIHDGIDMNTIRAACYGDHLALYANDEFIAEAQDSTYTEGYAGLVVASSENPVDIIFDNLTIYTVDQVSVVGSAGGRSNAERPPNLPS